MAAVQGQFIVIALTAFLPEQKGLQIVPADSIILAIYSKVFGPASHQDCETWVTQNGGRLFRVIVLTAALPSYQQCKIIPSDMMYIDTFSSAFGPDTLDACQRWVTANCGK